MLTRDIILHGLLPKLANPFDVLALAQTCKQLRDLIETCSFWKCRSKGCETVNCPYGTMRGFTNLLRMIAGLDAISDEMPGCLAFQLCFVLYPYKINYLWHIIENKGYPFTFPEISPQWENHQFGQWFKECHYTEIMYHCISGLEYASDTVLDYRPIPRDRYRYLRRNGTPTDKAQILFEDACLMKTLAFELIVQRIIELWSPYQLLNIDVSMLPNISNVLGKWEMEYANEYYTSFKVTFKYYTL
jgi:hypothetical protein